MRNIAIAYILITCVFVPWYNYERPKEIEPKPKAAIQRVVENDCGNYN